MRERDERDDGQGPTARTSWRAVAPNAVSSRPPLSTPRQRAPTPRSRSAVDAPTGKAEVLGGLGTGRRRSPKPHASSRVRPWMRGRHYHPGPGEESQSRCVPRLLKKASHTMNECVAPQAALGGALAGPRSDPDSCRLSRLPAFLASHSPIGRRDRRTSSCERTSRSAVSPLSLSARTRNVSPY
jgi:hypothetical protein